jgi:hypothetical protein
MSDKFILAALAFSLALNMVTAPAQSKSGDSKAPRYAPAYTPDPNQGKSIEPKNLPDFATISNTDSYNGNSGNTPGSGTALRAEAASTTLPVETRLTLVLECPVDAKVSKPGDIFEAHVKDDLFLGSTLLLPKGSLVRGRIVEVTRARLISKAAKIALKLEQIDTPTGEVIPLDAALEFRKGQTNARGQLDPGTSWGSRVSSSVKSVTGINSKGSTRGALMAANIATLGAPAAATLIGSSAIALFRSGDNVSLAPGQELEVLLTNDLGLQVN